MLANLLIGLREGLEAALIVGILVAYLVKLGHKKQLRTLWVGVVSAVATSILVGILLSTLVAEVPAGTQEIIAGGTSILAVGFVTWMIFWMARQSKNLSGELRSKMDKAIDGSAIGLAAVAFFAVIREGIETSVFIWSAAQATGSDTYPVLGATIGLLIATALGYLIYRGALKINLSKFFKYTGAFLVVVAAGIFAYGIHELQEVGLLPFLTEKSYDLSGVIQKDGVLDSVLRGTISFRSAPSQLETLIWFAYLLPTAWLFSRASQVKK